MTKMILLVQRYCPHCVLAAKINVDLGSPFQLRFISESNSIEGISRLREWVKQTGVPSMPVIITKMGDSLFFSRVPWDEQEMKGYMEEFADHKSSMEKMMAMKITQFGGK